MQLCNHIFFGAFLVRETSEKTILTPLCRSWGMWGTVEATLGANGTPKAERGEPKVSIYLKANIKW